MTKPTRSPAKPHAKAKRAARVLSPDEQWAADIEARVLADCHPYQLPAVKTEHRFLSLLVGRGGGKTTTMRARALKRMTAIRKARIVYTAPTRPMAKELNWDKLKDTIEHYGLMNDFEFYESELRCVCKRTGSFYKLFGIDDQGEVDKARGQPFDEVQADEASLYKATLLENFHDRAVGPRLGERNGVFVLGGTPGHILSGPFYDFTRPGATVEDPETGEPVPLHVPFADLDKHPGWDSYASFHWTARDVYELPNASVLYGAIVNNWLEALRVKKRKRWSDQNPIWLREYLAQWAADQTGMVFFYQPHVDGKPWNQWDPYGDAKLDGVQALRAATTKLREMHPDFKDWRFVVAGDKGSTHPFALNVFAFSPRDPAKNFWHVMPFERTKMYIKQWAVMLVGGPEPALLSSNPAKDSVYGIIGWPDGAVLDSDQTTIDELANVYGVPFEKADRNPFSKVGAVELTNGDLVDGRIKIIKGSPLEQQLMSLQWAEDPNGRLIENKAQANHSSDTLVYGRKKAATLYETGMIEDESKGGNGSGAAAAVRAADAEAGLADREPDLESLLAEPQFEDDYGGWP